MADLKYGTGDTNPTDKAKATGEGELSKPNAELADKALLDWLRIKFGEGLVALKKERAWDQIHDAIMIEAPENEVERTKQMFNDTMGRIDIPIPNSKPLRLDIDIDVLTRWGEKKKED